MSKDKCPIKGVSDDCTKCSENYYEKCVYVTTWKYIHSEEFRKNKGKPFEPIIRGSARRRKEDE